jgi:hypothetical protein
VSPILARITHLHSAEFKGGVGKRIWNFLLELPHQKENKINNNNVERNNNNNNNNNNAYHLFLTK